LTDIKNSLCVW